MIGRGGRATRAKGRSSSQIGFSDPCFQMGFEAQFVRFVKRLTEGGALDETVFFVGYLSGSFIQRALSERICVLPFWTMNSSKFCENK
jgi:hypothetical protein